jgi:hypothetical protein
MILFLTILWSIGFSLFMIFGFKKAYKEGFIGYPWHVHNRAMLWPLYCIVFVLNKIFYK